MVKKERNKQTKRKKEGRKEGNCLTTSLRSQITDSKDERSMRWNVVRLKLMTRSE
jgi:hypothetical protein